MITLRSRKSLLLSLLLLGASGSIFVETAEADAKNPCIKMSQTEMVCRSWFRNTGRAAIELGDWVLKNLKGQKTDNGCTLAAFKERPELWENLRVTRGRRFPTDRNQLMIYNTVDGMAPVIKKTLGFCYGHATLRNYYTRLSFFDLGGKMESLPPFKEGSEKWIEFYFERMTKIARGEPQVIPGFSDLKSFSENVHLNPWFKRQAAEVWSERAAHLKNMVHTLDMRDMTSEFSYKIVQDLQERLDQGYNPLIMFDENRHPLVKDEYGSLHVVSVVALHKMENNRTAIVILDDKKPMPNSYDVLVLHHKGGKDRKHAYGYFEPWRWKNPADKSEGGWDFGMGTVNQIRITEENDLQAMKMTLNLAAFCEKRPEVCKTLGDETLRAYPKPVLPEAYAPLKEFKYAE